MSYVKYEVYVYADGDKFWHLNDKCHREDGPAIERANGDKHWYLNDKHHREDGPAIECAGGTKHWCLNGKYLTKDEFDAKMNIKNKPQDCSNRVIEVDGVEYISKKKGQ